MLRHFASSLHRRSLPAVENRLLSALFSTLDRGDMPYLHHGKRPRFRGYEKFKSPRKRANILLYELNKEAVDQSKASKPKVWDTNFRVGDAIEIEMVLEGGVKSDDTEKIRGVVLGIFRKKMDTSVLIRDVVFGEPIERRVPLHSPLLRSLKVLEKNFVNKGKKRVRRAKLYYLSDRNPLGKFGIIMDELVRGFVIPLTMFLHLFPESRVTKW